MITTPLPPGTLFLWHGDRAFVATVTYADGSSITTTIYGPTVSAAETLALRDRAQDGAVRVIARSELR